MTGNSRVSVGRRQTGRWLVLACAAIVAFSAQSASALDASMFVEGASGDITCDGGAPGDREGSFTVLAFGYSVEVPLDQATGGIQGRRQHKPVTVRIDSGCSGVPQLYGAVFSNEILPRVTIRLYRQSAEGQTENYFTVGLENVAILGITAAGAGPQGDTELLVSFSFRRISLTYEDGGVEAVDDWREPAQ